MKKLLILANALMLMVLSCGNSGSESKSSGNAGTGSKKYRIGITQIVSHPALDSAREGFKAAFKEAGINAEFDEKNANGETTNSNLIANNFVSSKEDLIFAIATNAAQSASQATNDIPVVFAAITDPQSAGILKNNVTGVSDRMDVKQQLELLKKIAPNTKNVGVIYNSSEQNSKIQVEDLKKAAKELGLNIVEKSVVQANEIPQAVDNLVREADAIYLPTDNLVASVVSLITDKATAAKKIVFGAEAAHVKGGALITQGVSYYEIGKEAGKMAIEILKNGKKPSEIKFKTMPLSEIEVNEKTLAALGISLPEDVKSKAKMIQ
ncbi:ABC transporter substrate-binding protein [Leptotrichia shahii]|uniref:ABC transporter substrate-binding protein n=1 Tax=Leptotrichia shahii TaxID=157691 RepID=UPI0028D20A6E|nr:ABC transporter substrate-binding protein [Leptotrichia shahii]